MRTVPAVALGLAVALIAVPAHADQLTVHDKAGDVSEGRVGSSGGTVVQSTIHEGDVLRTTFRHGPSNVVVTSTFRALNRVGTYHAYFLRLQTGAKLYREVDVEAGPGLWAGKVTVTRRDGTRVRCGVTHRIDYSLDTLRVVVPRSCLGKPVYVRGTAANAWTRPDDQDPSQPDYTYLDNPHNTDDQANVWTRWIKH